MRSCEASSRAGRAVVVALGSVALLVLGFVAFQSLGRRVAPVEAEADGSATQAEAPSILKAVESVPERDAIEATTSPPDSRQGSAALGSEAARETAEVIVWGFVRDAEKQPIANASVGFTSALGNWRSAKVADDGSYSMPGLEPGRWFVRASASGFAVVEVQVEIDHQAGRVQRDFTLEPQPSLLVRVVAPDGRAFSEANVDPSSGKQRWTELMPIATLERPEEEFVRFNHNDRYGVGHKRFTPRGEAPAGLGAIAELDLFAPLPVFVSLLLSEEVIATQQVLPGSTEVVFVLDPSAVDVHFGVLHLTFVDAESLVPLQQASVTMIYPGGGMSPRNLSEGGRVDIPRCTPGRYEIRTWAAGFANSTVSIDVAAGELVERTIELARGVLVTGRCVDELDRPIVGEFAINPLPEPGELPKALEEDGSDNVVLSNDDGSIEFQMEPGLWLLQPQESTFRRRGSAENRMGPNLVLDTRSGPVTNLIVKLQPASSAVVSWSGSDPESLHVWFLDEAGHVRSLSRLGSSPRSCKLPPGNWQARVLDAKNNILEKRDFMLGSEPVVLELGLGR